jgi:hypothetical protein
MWKWRARWGGRRANVTAKSRVQYPCDGFYPIEEQNVMHAGLLAVRAPPCAASVWAERPMPETMRDRQGGGGYEAPGPQLATCPRYNVLLEPGWLKTTVKLDLAAEDRGHG